MSSNYVPARNTIPSKYELVMDRVLHAFWSKEGPIPPGFAKGGIFISRGAFSYQGGIFIPGGILKFFK